MLDPSSSWRSRCWRRSAYRWSLGLLLDRGDQGGALLDERDHDLPTIGLRDELAEALHVVEVVGEAVLGVVLGLYYFVEQVEGRLGRCRANTAGEVDRSGWFDLGAGRHRHLERFDLQLELQRVGRRLSVRDA